MSISGKVPGEDTHSYDVGLRDEEQKYGGTHQLLPVPDKDPGQVVEEVGGEEVAVPGCYYLWFQVKLAKQGPYIWNGFK